MIWGMTTSTFTLVHVWLSLIGIGAGLVVMFGLLAGKSLGGWTALFMIHHGGHQRDRLRLSVRPSPAVSQGRHRIAGRPRSRPARPVRLVGPWCRVYAVCAGLALYLNVFVAVVQAFEKVPFLNAMAPTQTEPAFVVAQVAVLALFAVLIIGATRRFGRAPVRLA